jgi:hypothetical protein
VRAGGDFNMEGEAVEQVAAPLESFAGGEKLQSCEIDDRAIRGWREWSAWHKRFCEQRQLRRRRW